MFNNQLASDLVLGSPLYNGGGSYPLLKGGVICYVFVCFCYVWISHFDFATDFRFLQSAFVIPIMA